MTKIHLFDANDDGCVDFAPGDVIFSEGDAGDFMYVVVSGEVDILLGNRVIDSTDAGGIVGEMAVIDGAQRSATALARTAVRAMPINQRRFLYLVQQTPFFAVQVMQILTERHRRRLFAAARAE
ncbi:MAG TPA: cyclic nucleotide-binding domain-containing protein [Candidatus Binatia bacterium]